MTGGWGGADALTRWVVHLYRVEQLSTYKIAGQVGLSRRQVAARLHGAGVTVAQRGRGRPRSPKYRAHTADLAGELRRLYVDRRLSSAEIARQLQMSPRVVRARLAEYGIDRRSRASHDRAERIGADPAMVKRLYADQRLSAGQVAAVLGVSSRVVLRTAHDHGIPVRPGGPCSGQDGGAGDIRLLDALYADPGIVSVLSRHRIPIRRAGGSISERFPDPVPLGRDAMDALYRECGLGLRHLELLTGQPNATLRRRLHEWQIPARPPGSPSPFLLRWRTKASADVAARLAG